MALNVLILIAQFPPAVRGGAEMQCWKQARALAARGHAVTLLTPWLADGAPRWEVVDGVRIGRLGWYLPWMAWRRALAQRFRRAPPPVRPTDSASGAEAAPGGRSRHRRWTRIAVWLANGSFIADIAGLRLFRRLAADVVHVHMSGWLAGFGQWLAEKMNAPVFCKEATFPVMLHDEDPNVFVPWKSGWLARRRQCRFVAITPAIADGLVAAGIARERIVIIPNGVEVPPVAVDPRSSSDALCIGHYIPGDPFKGYDCLFEAWGLAIRQEPAMRLRLFGRGIAAAWEDVAARHGCGQTVVFAGETDDVWFAHQQAGFYVLPSRREGLSNALLEAMASGLPCVVSDIPGNRAAIRDGIEGLVVPVDDPNALAAAMRTLYRQPDLRARLGQAARARVASDFAMTTVVQQLEEAYHRAVTEPQRESSLTRRNHSPAEPEGN